MILIKSKGRVNKRGEEGTGQSQLMESSCILGLIEKEMKETGRKRSCQRIWIEITKKIGGGWHQRRDIRFFFLILDLKTENKSDQREKKCSVENNCQIEFRLGISHLGLKSLGKS